MLHQSHATEKKYSTSGKGNYQKLTDLPSVKNGPQTIVLAGLQNPPIQWGIGIKRLGFRSDFTRLADWMP